MLIPGLTLAADDLTGAAEVAAGASRSWDARLLDWRHAAGELPPRPGLAASINTGSRHLPVPQAVERLRRLLAELSEDAWFYKKCDSTLRGPIAEEVKAVRERFPNRPLWYIGAAPGAGRTVRDGRVYVEDQPVADTDFARDPLFPVKTSELPLLFAEAGMSTALWQPGQEAVENADIIVADGRSLHDLEQLAASLSRLPSPPMLAGAGAFVPLLPKLMGAPMGELSRGLAIGQPCLILNGSLHPVGLKQVVTAEQAGTAAIVLQPDCFFGPNAERQFAGRVAEARTLLRQGASVIVRTVAIPEETNEFRAAAEKAGYSGHTIHVAITETLARFGSALLEETMPHTLISFGGELAEQLWLSLRVREARMLGFAHDHLAVTEAVTETNRQFVWATKPGGFGAPTLLTGLLHV